MHEELRKCKMRPQKELDMELNEYWVAQVLWQGDYITMGEDGEELVFHTEQQVRDWIKEIK